jgi:hypothetical protein
MHGIYFFAPVIQDDLIISEMYQGLWNRNKKDGNGLYIWKCDDPSGNNKWFEAYFGILSNDNYKQACWISNQGGNIHFYFGGFDQDGLKDDRRGIYYFPAENKVIIGDVENNKLLSGYFIYYDDKEAIKKMFYVEANNPEGKIDKLVYKDEMNEDSRNSMLELSEAFLVWVNEKDYFSDIINHFDLVKKKVDNINSFEMFDNDDDFPRYLDILSTHNRFIGLYNNLKKI